MGHVVRPRASAVLRRLLPAALFGLVAVVGAVPAGAETARGAQPTWHGEMVHAEGGEVPGRRGAGVLVAVLDSWVDGTHPDFQGRVLAGVDCTGGRCVDGQHRDACTHGTHVAGTVASTSFGVATAARVLPVQVLAADPKTGECSGQASDVIAGIRYAVASGARVINLSLGADVPDVTLGPSVLGSTVAAAARAGVLVVFSAGNDGSELTSAYGDDALVVGAADSRGRLATYSEHGPGVDLAAPGGDLKPGQPCTPNVCVSSLYPGGRYAVASGTSMAAPQVSGAAALLIAQDPKRTRQDVTRLLELSARPLAGAGSGLLDVTAALAEQVPVPQAAPSSGATAQAAQPPSTVPSSAGSPAPRPSATSRPTGTPTAAATLPRPAAEPVPVAAPPLPGPARAVPLATALAAAVYVLGTGAGVLAAEPPRRRRRA